MLQWNGLTDKILACNYDNAASNDTQVVELARLPNTFDESNRIRCFNHTLQLSAKTLLKPFNVALASGSNNRSEYSVLELEEVNDEESAEDGSDNNGDNDGDDNDNDNDSDLDYALNFGDEDDGVDELEMLPSGERVDILEQTSDIRDAVTKVSAI